MIHEGSRVLDFLAWITGVVVSLVVGFGMVKGVLGLPGWLGGETTVGMWVVIAVGWIVIVTTLISAVFEIIRK